MEEGTEEGGEKKTEDEKTEETNGADAAANEDKEGEVEQKEEKKENGEDEEKVNGEEEESTPERKVTPAPIIEKAEEVRQISEVDDCKAPIIDNSSSESEEEEVGAVKVRHKRCPSCHSKSDKMIVENEFTIFFHHQ